MESNTTAQLPATTANHATSAPSPAVPTAAFDAAVVGLFVALGDAIGAPKSLASIYGIIFASPRPLSFAEVEERLHLSKGSVSQGLKVLREIGAIRVAPAGGGRALSSELGALSQAHTAEADETSDVRSQRSEGSVPCDPLAKQGRQAPADHSGSQLPAHGSKLGAHYIPDMELRKLVLRFVAEKLEPQLADVGARLGEINSSIPYADRAEADELRQRLAKIRTWHKKAKGLMPVAKTFLNIG